MKQVMAELYVCDNCSHVELETPGVCPECAKGRMVCTDFVPASRLAELETLAEQMADVLRTNKTIAEIVEKQNIATIFNIFGFDSQTALALYEAYKANTAGRGLTDEG